MGTIVWNSFLLACVGTILVRLAGRKSVSQMTTPQIAILLTIGSVLGSEVGGKGMWYSIIAAAVFIGFLVATEWITLKWNKAENLLKGKSVPVISEGKLLYDNLKMLRISVDDLEKRLRLVGISTLADIKTGTIESNGEFGYELMDHAKPVTRGDLEKLLKTNFPQVNIPVAPVQPNIFTEVVGSSAAGEKTPEHLQ
ncbi:DUF421 domain-containing protein [Paenibacillus sp. J22TS3]|uniref:DUF421 domain-containing protein n=1 Tax=Paenibacillus sp. J22TS3 TaxID=2807192 RepID=UPI001B2B7CE5|nr:YetF domain-containing protein [Paenibacillus sp. J22TS3]GIP21150.1 DUF421 domain-containing protein [Paenibacillus sp. J22TS3]